MMANLTAYDVATKDISFVYDTTTIGKALTKLDKSGLRTIVVKNKEENIFYLLTAGDFVNFKLRNTDYSTVLNSIKLKKAKTINKDMPILNILEDINEDSSYMLVVDEENKIEGILSCSDIVSGIDPEFLIRKQSIGNFITHHILRTAYCDEGTLGVISQIKSKVDGAIVVIEDQKPVGIFTTKDVIKLLKKDMDFTRPIKEYMTSPVEYIRHNTPVAEALEYIKTKKYKRIVVVDNQDRLLGKITQQDLIRLFYSKWVKMLKQKGRELSKTNKLLDKKYKKLQEETNKDYLTKIFTRHKFDEHIRIEIEKMKRYKDATFSLAIIDIDNFKQVNDKFGHLRGDKVLKKMVKLLISQARKSDVVARWGGEEFTVLLSGTSLENAVIVAEKFCSAIRDHKFKKVGRITCSIGLASYKRGDTKDTIFERADRALYMAKQNGKDRVKYRERLYAGV